MNRLVCRQCKTAKDIEVDSNVERMLEHGNSSEGIKKYCVVCKKTTLHHRG